MTADHEEIETKYAVDGEAALPSLEGLPGVVRLRRSRTTSLEATYFDTADLDLASAGIVLRRRTGGSDAGWHLKLPTSKGRQEVHEPLGRAVRTAPKSLRELLVAHVRGKSVAPVATVRARRTAHLLLDGDGRPLAEVSDDRVEAQGTRSGDEPISWREWEAELVEGDASLLDAVGHRLVDAGARPSGGSSKLALVLGDRVPATPESVRPTVSRNDPAASVVQARLQQQVTELLSRDPLARRDAPDGVHKMRVAVRRLRNALATFRPFLVREQGDEVRAELKWLADALGGVRDAEVMRARLLTRLDDERGVVDTTTRERVRSELDTEHARARQRLLEVLGSDRYLALLDRLDELAVRPPWTDRAQEPTQAVVRKRVRKDDKRLRRRLEAADAAQDAHEREHLLHEARKAAKRLRYACESVKEPFGKKAVRLARAVEKVQSHLGEHHDAVVCQARLRELARTATATGEDAFAYGVLHVREELALRRAEARFEKAWDKVSRAKLRRWL